MTPAGPEDKRILVVDDDDAVIQVLTRHLRSQGWEVRSASRAEEALELLAAEKFRVILLDITMPGMTGFEALPRIAALTAAPVLLMSGNADSEFRKDALLLGAADLLSKPMTLAEVDTALAKVLK